MEQFPTKTPKNTKRTQDQLTQTATVLRGTGLRILELKSNEKGMLAEALAPVLRGRSIVFDIGAGLGELTAKLCNSSNVVTAIEPRDEFQPLLRSRLGGADSKHSVIMNKFEEVDLPLNQADAMLFSHSLYYIPIDHSFFNKIKATLKPDGIAVFVVLASSGEQHKMTERLAGKDSAMLADIVSRYEYLNNHFAKFRKSDIKTELVCSAKEMREVIAFLLSFDESAKRSKRKEVNSFIKSMDRDGMCRLSTEHALFVVPRNEL